MLFRKKADINELKFHYPAIYGVYIHLEATCPNCGNECWYFPAGIMDWRKHLTRGIRPDYRLDDSMCLSCEEVLQDYDRVHGYDEFDEDEDDSGDDDLWDDLVDPPAIMRGYWIDWDAVERSQGEDE